MRYQSQGAGSFASPPRRVATFLSRRCLRRETRRPAAAPNHPGYALVLAPALFNDLFRLYPGTDVLALERLRRLCTAGIYKAAIEGGALVDRRVGALILGQDMQAGYAQQDGVHYHLYVSESIVLRIDEPKAICAITAGAPNAA
jgi:uncharacterized linocin/CFP29 family protein